METEQCYNLANRAMQPSQPEFNKDDSGVSVEISASFDLSLGECESLSCLMEACQFEWVDSRITEALKNQRYERKLGTKRIHLLSLREDMSTRKALRAIRSGGFNPGGIQLLLELGRAGVYQNSKKRVIEIGESWYDGDDRRWLINLVTFGSKPALTCASYGNDWVSGSIVVSTAFN